MDFKVGKITHYFDKIGVAVVEVLETISVGDKIKIASNNEDGYTMTVESMQIEHEQVSEANKGQTVGMKVNQPVKPGAAVFKVSQ